MACGRLKYLRSLVLADLHEKNTQTLLQNAEAEHTRLTLLAAQQGKRLTLELLRELRKQAIIDAPALVGGAVHLLRQKTLPDKRAEKDFEAGE